MSWVDPRLEFSGHNESTVTLLPALLDDIWMPDIFFTNAKEVFKHEVIEQSKKFVTRLKVEEKLRSSTSIITKWHDFCFDTIFTHVIMPNGVFIVPF